MTEAFAGHNGVDVLRLEHLVLVSLRDGAFLRHQKARADLNADCAEVPSRMLSAISYMRFAAGEASQSALPMPGYCAP